MQAASDHNDNDVSSPYETDTDDAPSLSLRRRRAKRRNPGPLAGARLRQPDGGGWLQRPYSHFYYAVTIRTAQMYRNLHERTLEKTLPYRTHLHARTYVNNPAAAAAFEQYCKALRDEGKAIDAIDTGTLKLLQWHRDNATVPDIASSLTPADIAATIARNERVLAIRFTR